MNVSIIIILCAALFFAAIPYLKAKTTVAKVLTSCLMAGIFAFCAYFFVPNSNFDLARHHDMAIRYSNIDSVEQFSRISSKNDLEILPQVYSLLIGKVGNINLMQAIPVFIGYGLLFYMLVDYKNRNKIQNKIFLPLLLFIVFGQHMLYYFSGLYNYFAINLFSFAVYLDYILGRKKVSYALYILSPFIHISMLLPLGLMAILKCLKKRINYRFYIMFALAMIGFETIIAVIANTTNIDFLMTASRTYESYVSHNDYMSVFYDGFYLLMTVIKMVAVLLAYWITKNNSERRCIDKYACMVSVATIVLSLSSLAITRFSSLALFVASPMLLDAANTNGSNKAKVLRVIILVFAIAFAIYSVYTVIPYIRIGVR